eukprot:COSAG01_NODE_340_length_18638_cov_56.516505_14_plen_230_part_00
MEGCASFLRDLGVSQILVLAVHAWLSHATVDAVQWRWSASADGYVLDQRSAPGLTVATDLRERAGNTLALRAILESILESILAPRPRRTTPAARQRRPGATQGCPAGAGECVGAAGGRCSRRASVAIAGSSWPARAYGGALLPPPLFGPPPASQNNTCRLPAAAWRDAGLPRRGGGVRGRRGRPLQPRGRRCNRGLELARWRVRRGAAATTAIWTAASLRSSAASLPSR